MDVFAIACDITALQKLALDEQFCKNGKSEVHPTERDRFWKRVVKSENCWNWIGGTNNKGYGTFSKSLGGTELAHRYSYELHIGIIPKGLHVCHRCDNPSCVNPLHLFIGTAKENQMDSVRKGRHIRGERSGRSKLTEEDVRIIRKLAKRKESQGSIGRRFGVSQTAVSAILRGRKWKHQIENPVALDITAHQRLCLDDPRIAEMDRLNSIPDPPEPEDDATGSSK